MISYDNMAVLYAYIIYQNVMQVLASYSLHLLLLCYALTYLDRASRRDGRVWPWFQRWKLWRNFTKGYFNAAIHVEEPLSHEQLYIFCAFPHGSLSAGHLLTMTDACNMLSRVHRGERRDLAATILFYLPIIKELLLWCGCVDASAATAKYNLKRGRSLLIYVGGEKEQLLTQPRVNKVVLSNRKGFIKLALQYGAHLVPMYTFGENEVYHTSHVLLGFRLWLQRCYQIGIPLIYGKYGSPIPFRVTLVTEMGKAIVVNKVPEADITPSMIDALHKQFTDEMIRLFDRTKQSHGYKHEDTLTIL